MKRIENLKSEKEKFFEFMSAKYPVIYRSNVFFRDIQYAIFLYFKYKEDEMAMVEAEELAREFTDYLVATGEFKPLNDQTWFVNFEIKSTVLEEKEVNSEE